MNFILLKAGIMSNAFLFYIPYISDAFKEK